MMRRVLMAALLASVPLAGSAEQVGNLNPRGDNYLSLRAGPSGKALEISRMGPGTELTVLGRDGVWRYVRTGDGREGWAHSSYILAGGTTQAPPVAMPPVAVPPVAVPPVAMPMVLAPMAGPAPPPTGDVLAPMGGPGVAQDVSPGALDWLTGHMMQFHDPLKYYP